MQPPAVPVLWIKRHFSLVASLVLRFFAGKCILCGNLSLNFLYNPFFCLGVHRQVLLTTIGWFLGYQLTKYANYVNAKLDRDMMEYVKLHPVDFPPTGE